MERTLAEARCRHTSIIPVPEPEQQLTLSRSTRNVVADAQKRFGSFFRVRPRDEGARSVRRARDRDVQVIAVVGVAVGREQLLEEAQL
jgi:hypothetical protein